MSNATSDAVLRRPREISVGTGIADSACDWPISILIKRELRLFRPTLTALLAYV